MKIIKTVFDIMLSIGICICLSSCRKKNDDYSFKRKEFNSFLLEKNSYKVEKKGNKIVATSPNGNYLSQEYENNQISKLVFSNKTIKNSQSIRYLNDNGSGNEFESKNDIQTTYKYDSYDNIIRINNNGILLFVNSLA